jgi:hypothetical protein
LFDPVAARQHDVDVAGVDGRRDLLARDVDGRLAARPRRGCAGSVAEPR